jgi:hypothetical protein
MTSAMMTLLMPGPKRVDEQQVHKAIEPASGVTRDHSDQETGESATADDRNCHHQRDARAVNRSR